MPVVLPLCSAAGDTSVRGCDAYSQNAQRQETSFPKAAPRPGEQSARGKEQGQVTYLQHGRSMPRRAEGSAQDSPLFGFEKRQELWDAHGLSLPFLADGHEGRSHEEFCSCSQTFPQRPLPIAN